MHLCMHICVYPHMHICICIRAYVLSCMYAYLNLMNLCIYSDTANIPTREGAQQILEIPGFSGIPDKSGIGIPEFFDFRKILGIRIPVFSDFRKILGSGSQICPEFEKILGSGIHQFSHDLDHWKYFTRRAWPKVGANFPWGVAFL